MIAFSARAENAYTNHAGNVASGVVIALDARTATISNAMETVKLPLSIFPELEQRRIAADFVLRQGDGHVDQLRVPVAVKRAVAGAEKGERFESLRGLSRRSPALAGMLAVCMFSLAGIPPVAGFLGKFFLFSSAAANGHYGFVVFAALNGTVSLYY
jgi:hypothetical protein